MKSRKLFIVGVALCVAGFSFGASPTLLIDHNGNALGVDKTTRSLQVVDYSHHEIHEGNHFYSQLADSDLDTAETNGFIVVTSNSTKWVHMIMAVDCSSSADFLVYEGTAQTNLGTAVTAVNNNRNSANEAITSVYLFTDTSVTNLGTLVYENLLGTSHPQTRSGGATRGDAEIILKQNSTYSVILVGQADNGRANFELEWYEHTSKD